MSGLSFAIGPESAFDLRDPSLVRTSPKGELSTVEDLLNAVDPSRPKKYPTIWTAAGHAAECAGVAFNDMPIEMLREIGPNLQIWLKDRRYSSKSISTFLYNLNRLINAGDEIGCSEGGRKLRESWAPILAAIRKTPNAPSTRPSSKKKARAKSAVRTTAPVKRGHSKKRCDFLTRLIAGARPVCLARTILDLEKGYDATFEAQHRNVKLLLSVARSFDFGLIGSACREIAQQHIDDIKAQAEAYDQQLIAAGRYLSPSLVKGLHEKYSGIRTSAKHLSETVYANRTAEIIFDTYFGTM
jgi:hypothetical protein